MAKTRKRKELASRREVAAALGVHPMTITKWERDGLPVESRGSRGRPSLYNLDVVRAWREAREQAARDLASGPMDLHVARARKEHFQALLTQQTLEVRAGKLIPAEVVEKRWAAEVAAARAVILASYTSSADAVFRAATVDGLAGVERELRTIAYGALRELSGGSPAASKRKRGAA